MKFLGYKLRELREAKKLSMRELEKLTGISQGYISLLENGAKTPRSEKVELLCKALNVHEMYFYLEDSRLPGNVLPQYPKNVEKFVLDEDNTPWLVLSEKAKEKGISLDTLDKIVDALQPSKN